MTTAVKIGIVQQITTIVPTTLYNCEHNILKFIGMVTSMISISLENRFNILPKGVVSKKLIGEYNIRSSILEENVQLIRVTFDPVVLTVFFTGTFIEKNLNLFLREIDKYHWGEMVLFFKGIFFTQNVIWQQLLEFQSSHKKQPS